MSQTVTVDELKKILTAHTESISHRVSGIIQHNNELILEYADHCIEAVSNLRVKESNLLDAVNGSFTQLEVDMIKDLEKILRKRPTIVPLPPSK